MMHEIGSVALIDANDKTGSLISVWTTNKTLNDVVGRIGNGFVVMILSHVSDSGFYLVLADHGIVGWVNSTWLCNLPVSRS